FQDTFLDSLHSEGRPVSALTPSPAGPRHCGQSPALASLAKKSNATIIETPKPLHVMPGHPDRFRDSVSDYRRRLASAASAVRSLWRHVFNVPLQSLEICCLSWHVQKVPTQLGPFIDFLFSVK